MRADITVPIDPSRAPTQAEAVAAALARQSGMTVEVVAAPPPAMEISTTERRLEDAARRLAAAGASVAGWHRLPGGDIAGSVVSHLEELDPQVVCMATHARGPAGEAVLGSVSESVLRRSPVPVLLAGPGLTTPAGEYRRVVVALDGSPHAEAALPFVARLAPRLAASVVLVEVLAGSPPASTDVLESSYLHRVAETLSVAVDYDTLHGDDAARAIVDFAAAEGGTIVAATTHGRTGVRRLVAGSVALGLVRRAGCPVLVVPPPAVERLRTVGAGVTVPAGGRSGS